MKLRKLVLCMLAASTLMASAVDAKTYKIGAAVYGLKGQFMQAWVKSIKDHPAVKDGTAQITVFDGNYDANTQNNQIETMITQHYDAIIFVPIDTKASVGAVRHAMAAGIPVVASNTKVASDKVRYIGNDDIEGGRLQTAALVKQIGSKGNVVIIEGPIGQSAQIDREKGEMEVLAKYPGIKVIEKKTANWDRAQALNLTEDWLNAHPKQINGIISQNDDMALGALQALKSHGMSAKDVPITGLDGMPDAIKAAQSGELITFMQDAQAQAQGALDITLAKLAGDSYKPRSVIWQRYGAQLKWADGKSASYIVPWVPVTPQNAAALYKQVTGD